MINITRQQAETITRRALDWLEANPDKHIRGEPAQNKYGMGCDPLAPSATCFCAIGRITKEAELDGISYHNPLAAATLVLDEIGVSDTYVWSINDYSDLDLGTNLKFVRAYVEKTAAIEPGSHGYLIQKGYVYMTTVREQHARGRTVRNERHWANHNGHSGQGV